MEGERKRERDEERGKERGSGSEGERGKERGSGSEGERGRERERETTHTEVIATDLFFIFCKNPMIVLSVFMKITFI